MPAIALPYDIDNVLVKALARALRWQAPRPRHLQHHQGDRHKEKIDPSYVG
jgi:hypothetical protein